MHKTIGKIAIILLGSTFSNNLLHAEELNSLEYWRIRHTQRSDEYIIWNYERSRENYYYPLLSVAGIAELCMDNPDMILKLPEKYKEIYKFGIQTYKINKNKKNERDYTIEFERLRSLYIINGQIDDAIEANRKAREWLWKDIEKQKIEKKNYQATPLTNSDIDRHKLLGLFDVELKQIANKKFGKNYTIHLELLNKQEWISKHPTDIQYYLLLLVTMGDHKRFQDLAEFEINKKGKSYLFMSQEIADMVFDDMLKRKKYWMTPEMKRAIEKQRIYAKNNLPSCRLADSYNLICVPWVKNHPKPESSDK